MKCYKCGKEAELSGGLCKDCYKNIIEKKNKKHKKTRNNFIFSNLDPDEKIISKLENSNLLYAFIVFIFAIAIILFPRTILEFCFRGNKIYFPILIANILLFFFGIFLILYFTSREICLTNKRLIGKWGLFEVKTMNIPLSNIEIIDTFKIKALEIDSHGKIYIFDYLSNADKFKMDTMIQVKNIIDSTTNEKELNSFSHSLNKKLKEFKLENENPNMIFCKCCGKTISKDSHFCVHCGQPIEENEQEADFFLKLLCFLIPPFGILIFLIHIGEHPKLSKQCLLSSIFSISIILAIYLSIILSIA